MRVTVLTPTYNRAGTLPRLFDSLVEQTFQDFEWVVVDDGSTDDTADLVKRLRDEADFPVVYLHQPNAGKHIALNAGVRVARGEFTAVIDSDDWYLPQALDTLLDAWDAIPDPERFAEVQALRVDQHGRLIGDRYPSDVFDTDGFAIRFEHNITGDKVGMHRTDVLRRFPFPEQFRGVLVSEAIVWHRIARQYKVRCLNQVLGGVEYLEGGYTKTNSRTTIAQAGPRRLLYSELVAMGRPLPFATKARMYANWVRFAIHTRSRLASEFRRAPHRLWFASAVPAGAALAARDRIRAARRPA